MDVKSELVIEKENLTHECALYYAEILSNNELYFQDYEDEDSYKDADCVFMKIIVDNLTYYIIHGFPGDTPSGILFNELSEVLYTLPDDEDSNNIIVKWYNNCMADCECDSIVDSDTCPRNHKDRHYWFWNDL
jgi:hypothetical protein